MENVKFIKSVDYTRPWIGKDGVSRPSVRYYLVAVVNGNEVWEAIKPAFAKAHNWPTIDKFAELRVKRDVNTSPSATAQ